MKTAVLVHGFNLGAEDWENVIWGDPRNGVYGVASKGILVALCENAKYIYWGTGASSKSGVTESRCIFEYAVTHLKELEGCKGVDLRTLEVWLRRYSYLDEESNNRKEEIAKAFYLYQKRAVEKIVLVSSPSNTPRCLRDADDLRLKDGFSFYLTGTSSDVCYSGSKPEDVFIMEPTSGRPDRSSALFNETLHEMKQFNKSPEIGPLFNEALKSLVSEWKKKLKK